MRTPLFFLFLFLFSTQIFGQQVFTRNGTLKAKLQLKSQQINAVNYQGAALVDLSKGSIVINALVKSFEIDLILANQLLSSTGPSSIPYPKITYEGKFKPFTLQAGETLSVEVSGKLTAWNLERITNTTATITRLPSGQISATTDFAIQIEPSTVEQLHQLMQEYLPQLLNSAIAIHSLEPKINIQVQLNLLER